MQFNKVNNPIYTTVSTYNVNEDGSISATYVVGTGEDVNGEITNFIKICQDYKHIPNEQAQELLNQPLSKDDIGKTPNEIMLDRIYNHLKSTNEIVV